MTSVQGIWGSREVGCPKPVCYHPCYLSLGLGSFLWLSVVDPAYATRVQPEFLFVSLPFQTNWTSLETQSRLSNGLSWEIPRQAELASVTGDISASNPLSQSTKEGESPPELQPPPEWVNQEATATGTLAGVQEVDSFVHWEQARLGRLLAGVQQQALDQTHSSPPTLEAKSALLPLPAKTLLAQSFPPYQVSDTLPPTILTPSLQQNQLPQVLKEPTFSAPPLSDLPSATLNVPKIQDQLLQPQPFLGQLEDRDILPPLQRNTLVPFPEAAPTVALAETPATSGRNRYRSPLERPMTRLFGFETATPLKQGELVLSAGGSSFDNPQDFRIVFSSATNRSNDIRFGLDYGISDQLQLSFGAEGKDDTIFANLVAADSGVSVIYQGLPAQVKWQLHEGEKLSSALIFSAQFPANTVPGNIINQFLSVNPSSRKIILALDRNVNNAILAEDSSVYFSLAAPVTYQWSPRIRLHVNPQVSVFPERIPVTNLRGNVEKLVNAGIGFDGKSLKYFGTIVGLGLGLDYDISTVFQFSADVTHILSGANTLASGGKDSLFVPKSVWNAGVRWTPNSRLGINLYLTNRFGSLTASPANLLVQPGGDSGIALDFIYLPDLIRKYSIVKRDTYPEPSAFLSGLNGFPSTTLPLDGVAYELAYGSKARFTQMARWGVSDDLELVTYRDTVSNDTFPIEVGLLGRLALVGDRGRPGVTAALSAGALGFERTNGATDVALYADLPVNYRARSLTYSLGFTPKLLVPTKASGRGNTLGITLDGRWNLSATTQLLGSYTSILSGENQLLSGKIGEPAQKPAGNVSLYSLGIRQIFQTDNSLYALDVYVGNTAGSYAQQGLLALPNGESQVGLRLSILNGIPASPDAQQISQSVREP